MAARALGASARSLWALITALLDLCWGQQWQVPGQDVLVLAEAGCLKVELLVIAEAGCPYCQNAVVRWLDDVLRAPGLADIVELAYHPFGNSFYATEACGGAPYNPEKRRCWACMCIGVEKPPCDCFTGEVVNQHGAVEGQVNRMMACAKRYAATWQMYWPFVVCMEREFGQQGLSAVQQCATVESQLDLAQLQACYGSPEGDEVVAMEAKATIDHDEVPHIAVNRQQVWTEEVLERICDAYTGTKPAACPPPAPPSAFWWTPRWQ